jgi:outer membrane protein
MKKRLNNIISIETFIFIAILRSKNECPDKTLTLEEAIKTALENNYEIKIAGNNVKISETNVSMPAMRACCQK